MYEFADVAQLVEHTLGKGEVTGSIPVVSSDILGKCSSRLGATVAPASRLVRPASGSFAMPRDKIILACNECKNRNYFTTKNKRLHPERVEWKKYCPRCNKHQTHKETK